jgi:hypothetical protein
MRNLLMNRSRRILIEGLCLPAFFLAGCDSGGGDGAVLPAPSESNPLHGKAIRDAREKAYGPSGNAPTGRTAAAPAAKSDAKTKATP